MDRDEGMIRWEKSELVARAGWRDYLSVWWRPVLIWSGLVVLLFSPVGMMVLSGQAGGLPGLTIGFFSSFSVLYILIEMIRRSPGQAALRGVYGDEVAIGRGVWSGKVSPFFNEPVAVRFGEERIELFTKGLQGVVREGDGVEVRVQRARRGLFGAVSYLVLSRGGVSFTLIARDGGKMMEMAERSPWVYRSVGGGRGLADDDAQLRELERQGFFRKEDGDG